MKTEHGIVLELCKETNDIILDISNNELKQLDSTELLGQLASHRIDSFVSNKRINGLEWPEINPMISRILNHKFQYINYYNDFIYENIIPPIVEALNSSGLPYAFTKGVVAAVILYDQVAYRKFGDIDILIRKKDLKAVKDIFAELGYEYGQYDSASNTIRKPTEEMVKFFEMTTHQTSPHTKIINDKILKRMEVDLNFGLGPEKNLKNNEMISKILERRINVHYKGMEFPGLSKEDSLIHCCMQIYRDSTAIFHIKRVDDVKLYQYVDLRRLITLHSNELDWNYIESIINEFSLKEQVYYSLYHCCLIFNDIGKMLDEFLNKVKPETTEYLNEFGMENKVRGVWKVPFFERIFLKERYSLIKEYVEQGNFEAYEKREIFKQKYT